MKKLTIMMIILLIALLPVALSAGTFWDNAGPAVNQLLGIVGTIILVPLFIKLGRKWGLDISDALAQDAIDALINILVNLDFGNGKTGIEKKRIAVSMAESRLTVEQKTVLEKKYGSLEAAVQVAFEKSSLNKNGRAQLAPTKDGK